MRKPQGALSLVVVVSGLYLFLSFSSVKGQDRPIPFEDAPTQPSLGSANGRPPLPETASAGAVAIYIAKIPDKPGFVCVRVVNDTPLLRNPIKDLLLQQREEGQFKELIEVLPTPQNHPGIIIGETLPALASGPVEKGTLLTRQMPLYTPLPPGVYRACVRYRTLQKSLDQEEACSEEISLP